jgi:hypothetical protein
MEPSGGQPHALYHALKAQLSQNVPEDVLWDEEEQSPSASTKAAAEALKKQQLIERLERRLGLGLDAAQAPAAPVVRSKSGECLQSHATLHCCMLRKGPSRSPSCLCSECCQPCIINMVL